MKANTPFQEEAINAIRFLAADAVQKAGSGHAGQPMGAAAIAYTLFTKHLKFNPANPKWVDRDRFILSAGHGSMLLYSLFYLTGYEEMTLDQLKEFRRPNSLTPGHPEYGHTAGVETTTGPLGQGLAVAVGMAIAEAHLAAVYNTEDNKIVNHYTYVIAGDGDLMEGVTSEASSLAGHLSLSKLICFYDDNRVTIDGGTDITFTEDRAKRYEAYGWQVLRVEDGNNVDEIDQAILKAKADPRPSMIICRTVLGYGYPTWGGLSIAHSGIPSDEELAGAKKALGYPTEPKFYVSDEVLAHYRHALESGKDAECKWQACFEAYSAEKPELARQFKRIMAGEFPKNWQDALPKFEPSPEGMATRTASHKIINSLAGVFPELVGGSADLSGSNSTKIENTLIFQKDSYQGRNIAYGVREHAMGAINNGLNQHGGLIAFAATFLVFSDYLRPAIRLSALSDTGSIWIFSHDSFCLGQDGPTHQPIEHLSSFRAMPNLVTLRPADANETAIAWKIAIERRHAPTLIALTRQSVPIFDRKKFASADATEKGAYVMADLGPGPVRLVLMATGSEVELIVRAAEILAIEGFGVRVISMPSWELFEAQPETYQNEVMMPEIKARLAVEAATSLGWHKWVGSGGKMITIDRFGASAPNDFLFKEFGFNVENILQKCHELLTE